MKGAIIVNRKPTSQPNANSALTSQKHYIQGATYNAQSINSEFDHIHERINKIVVQETALMAIPLVDSGANLAQVITALNTVITQLNAMTKAATDAGLLNE